MLRVRTAYCVKRAVCVRQKLHKNCTGLWPSLPKNNHLTEWGNFAYLSHLRGSGQNGEKKLFIFCTKFSSWGETSQKIILENSPH